MAAAPPTNSPLLPPDRSLVCFQRGTGGSRKLAKVPFVELFNGRIQAVAASSSDPSRVYVSWYEGRTGNFNCSTNNNRPCGGLRGGPCKHIAASVDEALAWFGAERVARAMGLEGLPGSYKRSGDIFRANSGSQEKTPANEVFSRYLAYLQAVELPPVKGPLPEMSWFVTG